MHLRIVTKFQEDEMKTVCFRGYTPLILDLFGHVKGHNSAAPMAIKLVIDIG